MTAVAVYTPSGSSGEIQFVNSSGLLDASQAFWDSSNAKLSISGSLEVLGTQTVIDTVHLQVEDSIIGLGSGSAGQGSPADRGFIFLINGETNPSIYWDESANEFVMSRVTNSPGDSTFNNPEAVGEGGFQDLKVGTIKAKSGGIFSTDNQTLAQVGDDAFLFVSGSVGSRGTSIRSTSVFGGDVVISGTLYGGSPLKIGGEIEFSSPSGATTSITNKDGSVKVFASKEVKIGSDDGIVRYIDLGGSTAGIVYLTGSQSTPSDRRFKFLSRGQIHLHGGHPHAASPGEDIFVFISGSTGSKLSSSNGVTLFGGDTVMSGTINALHGISGSITRLHDGSSFLKSGTDISIVTGSSGNILISTPIRSLFKKKIYEIPETIDALEPVTIPTLRLSDVGFKNDRIDVFVNGQMMLSGSSGDYVLVGNNTDIKFYFDLISGDIITVRTY